MRRLLFFLSVIFVVLCLSGYYLGQRLLQGSSTLAAHPVAVWTSIVLFLSLVFIGPMLSRILPESASGKFYVARWIVNMTMAIFFAVLFYTFTTDLTMFVLGFFVAAETSLALQSYSLAFIATLVIVTMVVGTIQALRPKVFRVEVPIRDLPDAFAGYKVAQISDLHIGEMIGPKYVEKVVEITNTLKADAIALTGDIVDGKLAQTAPVTALLARLKAADGTFYVTGNHEYYWGIENALGELKKAGAQILINEHAKVRRANSEIAFVGLPDLSSGGTPGHRVDVGKALSGLPREMIKIVLAHQPQAYQSILGQKCHLQLSGHTHGGQFFPWSLVVRLFQHYNKGLIRHDDLWIYVNRGTATWGPRLRFGIPPEITLLTLRKA